MELTKKEYAEFLEWKKKYKSKVWKPELGEKCFIIHMGWRQAKPEEICYDTSYEIYYDLGLMRKTKKEIEFLIERLKVTKELQDFAEENNKSIDWGDDRERKYCISYYNWAKCLRIDWTCLVKQNNIYFSSEEIAEQAIKTIGEERIKKYYLGV